MEWQQNLDAPTCPEENRNAKEVIAVLSGSTSRKVEVPSTQSLALFQWLLPSFAKSVECGFRYLFVLGYDQGDPFYDTETGMQESKDWFQEHIYST